MNIQKTHFADDATLAPIAGRRPPKPRTDASTFDAPF